MTLATYFRFFSDLTIELLGIILMPLGWFGVWEGFSKIVDTSPIFIQEEILFDKLSKAQYRFVYIEPNEQEKTGEAVIKIKLGDITKESMGGGYVEDIDCVLF